MIRIDELDHYGMTPLMYASKNHKIDMIRYLLQKGADKNKKCKYGRDIMYFSRDKQGRIPIAILIVIYIYYKFFFVYFFIYIIIFYIKNI